MRLTKLAAALGVGLFLSGTVMAQQPPAGGGGFGGFGGGGLVNSISRSKPLQEELKVDADQLEKLTAALTKAREETRDLVTKMFNRDTPAEERTELGKKMREINDKAVADVLKPEQVKRMKQLENQQAGMGLFTRADLAKPLNLTDEQKEKITKINTDLANDRREVQGNGGRGFGRNLDPEIQKKVQELQKEAMSNVVKVLNDEQSKAYKEMVGEHFDLPANLAFGGGFGAGGFGGPGGAPGGGFPGGGFGGGFGGGGQPGIVLSNGAQTTLKLTDDQKKELEVIQKDVDAKLEKMLTEDQRKQLKEMRDRQPNAGGRGGRTQPKKDN